LDAAGAARHGLAMTDRFGQVRELFEQNLAEGTDLGAAFCVTVDDQVVIDLYGGFADEGRTRPWQADTIVGVYSRTKTMEVIGQCRPPGRNAGFAVAWQSSSCCSAWWRWSPCSTPNGEHLSNARSGSSAESH
jgi:hypothetical protein